ncbi:PqqD family protein [Streptomyces sp. NPDC059853]|uniref:PqqD family protein n=1 Tax=Streptomyces sp. NPDC059853 TaxID=3346973 RepID=UPI003657FAE9
MTLSPETVPQPVTEARFRNFRGKTFVARGEHALELSETAALILKGVDGQRSVADLGQLVATEYDIDIAEAISDTSELLQHLVVAGVVVVNEV